jgi:hypothetical protein
MPGIYDTAVLTGTVNSLQVAPNFLLEAFFPTEVAEESEELHFDVEKDVMKLAPFVAPTVKGVVVTEKGYTTNTFKPAYVKQNTPINAATALKRVMGEKLLGELSAMQRMQLRTTSILRDHKTMLKRRLEWMASSILRTGKVTISGEGYPSVEVDFGRHANLTIALTAGDRWGETGVNPLDSLQEWNDEMLEQSGSPVRTVLMGVSAWKLFRENSDVNKRIETQKVVGQKPTLNQSAMNALGASYKGTIDEYEIWVYNQNFVDDAGATQRLMPEYAVIMVGDLMGVQQYGAILDFESLQAVPIFTKSWEENDPSLRVLLSQSSPLVVPYRVNATLCATVR